MNKVVKDDNEEILPIVDENGCVIGKRRRGDCHDGSKLLHPVVHLHALNKEGGLCLQLRPQWKQIQPGKWDTGVGGHVAYGENMDSALRREAFEELGLVDFNPVFLRGYIYESSIEREYVYVYAVIVDEGSISYSEEVDDVKFFTFKEIESNLGNNMFTPNFEHEYNEIKDSLKKLSGSPD